MRNAAANASPAPTGSATSIVCAGASMYSSPHSIAQPRAPSVTHTAFHPYRFDPSRQNASISDGSRVNLWTLQEFFFIELDYVGQFQQLDDKLHRIVAWAEVEVVEASRDWQRIQELVDQRLTFRRRCKQCSVIEARRGAMR